MLGRAELAFVVIDIAYVENSIINTEAFYTLMFTAFWLNVLVPLTIGFWKPRITAKAQPQPPWRCGMMPRRIGQGVYSHDG